MINIREKLVELLNRVQDNGQKTTHEAHSVTVCVKRNEDIADHLIANGVMFQRYAHWKDVMKFGSFCYAYCSNCCTEHKAQNYAALAVQYRFCKWCGARMVHQPPKGE